MAVWTTVLHVIDSTAVVMSRCIEFHTLLKRLLHMQSVLNSQIMQVGQGDAHRTAVS